MQVLTIIITKKKKKKFYLPTIIFNTLVNIEVKPKESVKDKTACEKSPFSFWNKKISDMTAKGTRVINT